MCWWRFGVVAVAAVVSGCQSPPLPPSADVELPDGSMLRAAIDSGPASLAGTVWACYRTDSDRFIARVEFAADGSVRRFVDNVTYYPDILGRALFADGRWRDAVFPGMTYAAGSYGGENESGFGFVGQLRVRLAGVEVGRGLAYSYGTASDDRMLGTFGFSTQVVNVPGGPFVAGDRDEYGFYGIRESLPDPAALQEDEALEDPIAAP